MRSSVGHRLAIVHDYLNQRGGAERVVATLHDAYPDAPIYTSIVDREKLWPSLRSADIRPTWMQKLPGISRHFKRYLPLFPWAFRSMDVTGHDLVLSSSSGFAHGVRTGAGVRHVCYCYTPPRFLWDYERYVEREPLGAVSRAVLPWVIELLRKQDLEAARRPDRYIAISRVVAHRVAVVYGREAEVIAPPVEVDRFSVKGGPGGFLLVVSRLNPYKRIELAIEACNRLKQPLLVVGEGPYRPQLEQLAGPTVRLLGYRRDDEVASLYEECEALIFPGEEDFGISVIEANAAGRPVVAYRAGGALDTVEPGLNGVFFDEPQPESVVAAILAMRRQSWDRWAIRRHAEQYSPARFLAQMEAAVLGRGNDMRRPDLVPPGR